MVQHALGKRRRADLPLLRIINGEVMVTADRYLARQDLRLHSFQVSAQVLAERQHLRFGRLASLRLVKGQFEVGHLRYRFNQIPWSFHPFWVG
jgi:hypothetical protein